MKQLVAVSLVLLASRASAQDATTPGVLTTPHPTLEHLSIEWAIDGDDDEDGAVSVRFRAAGTEAWRDAQPLFRVPAGSNAGHTWANRHAGSLFGLAAGTTYEIELALTDPDGGAETRMVSATTRSVPEVPGDARIVEVEPATIGAALSDASPGDVLLLSAGSYAALTVSASGEPGRPLVLRGASRDDVIVTGEIRMDGQSDVWLEDLTVRGQIKFNDSDRIVIRGCRVETELDGIVAFGPGTRDGYFVDNVVVGSSVWRESALGASGDNMGEGIVMTGPGNVIAYNRVERFRDCVSLLEDGEAIDQRSIDILGNDLVQCADDAIEADFSAGNVRVLRNRSTNSFIAWSSQPSLGGPTYFVRNVAFANYYQVFKPQRGSLGDWVIHNTVVQQGDAFSVYTTDPWGRAVSRNNLFIGGPESESIGEFSNGSGRILDVSTLMTANSSFDYDGFGSHEIGRFDGRFGEVRFDDFAGLRSMTTEAHAVQVDVDVFAMAFGFPRGMFPPVAAPDLRLAAGSAAVDVGAPLANLNDGFGGSAPDLGAYELGSALPPYGPRGAEPLCGNAVVEAGEGCDDGNTTAGDGCSAICQVESLGGADGGMGDGGVADGGSGDVGSRGDAAGGDGGPEGTDTEGCGCRVGAQDSPAGWAALAAISAMLWGRRRRANR